MIFINFHHLTSWNGNPNDSPCRLHGQENQTKSPIVPVWLLRERICLLWCNRMYCIFCIFAQCSNPCGLNLLNSSNKRRKRLRPFSYTTFIFGGYYIQRVSLSVEVVQLTPGYCVIIRNWKNSNCVSVVAWIRPAGRLPEMHIAAVMRLVFGLLFRGESRPYAQGQPEPNASLETRFSP